jgi:hypothetical protein
MQTSAALRLQEDADAGEFSALSRMAQRLGLQTRGSPSAPGLPSYDSSVATVFPGTATVESDFSALKRELDEFRSTLMELLLKVSCNANSKSLRR